MEHQWNMVELSLSRWAVAPKKGPERVSHNETMEREPDTGRAEQLWKRWEISWVQQLCGAATIRSHETGNCVMIDPSAIL